MSSTSAASSSLAITRSTCGNSSLMHARASSLGGVPFRQFQSFLRKFRSHETVAPAAFAAFTSARFARQAASLIAGVMPVTCSHVTPARAAAKSYSSAAARLTALCVAVVDHRRTALVGRPPRRSTARAALPSATGCARNRHRGREACRRSTRRSAFSAARSSSAPGSRAWRATRKRSLRRLPR